MGDSLSGPPAYVLAGGRSARMGQDKARVLVDGLPMAVRVARALLDGGASSVHVVGKDPSLADLHLGWVPDLALDHHPLVGVVAALRHAAQQGATHALLSPCDLPWLTASAVSRLVLAGGPAAAGDGTNRQPLLCLLDVARADALEEAAQAHVSVRAALRDLPTVLVPAAALRNVNHARDLDGDPGRPTR